MVLSIDKPTRQTIRRFRRSRNLKEVKRIRNEYTDGLFFLRTVSDVDYDESRDKFYADIRQMPYITRSKEQPNEFSIYKPQVVLTAKNDIVEIDVPNGWKNQTAFAFFDGIEEAEEWLDEVKENLQDQLEVVREGYEKAERVDHQDELITEEGREHLPSQGSRLKDVSDEEPEEETDCGFLDWFHGGKI